jgi:hypothetical protein
VGSHLKQEQLARQFNAWPLIPLLFLSNLEISLKVFAYLYDNLFKQGKTPKIKISKTLQCIVNLAQ